MSTSIKILLDGKYFGYGTDLQKMADLACISVERFSFDEQDLARNYSEFRRKEYPPIGDQLDTLWKMIEPAAGSEAATMKEAILAVKSKYPKP